MGNDREVIEGQVFEISYSYNSSVGTHTYIKYYDEKYLDKVHYSSHYHGEDGMTGCSSTRYVYFKAKKRGNTKIILGHEFRGTKTGNTSIKVKIKKNDGKTPIENIEYKTEKRHKKEMPNKICLIGNSNVGKTSLIKYFNQENFNDIYEPTQVACFINLKITYKMRKLN